MNSFLNLLKELDIVGQIIIGLILSVFIAAFVFNLIVRKKYVDIQNDLLDWHRRKEGSFKSDIIKKIIDDYKNTAIGSYSEVNTQAIIEKAFNLRLRGLAISERFIKSANSILITLGLLGTFVGLTIAVGEIAAVFRDMDINVIIETQGKDFFGGLITSLGGMAVAFLTSLVGITCSIILTILYSIVNAEEARETLMVHIEEYLDNTVSVVVAKDKETEYTMMNNILRETFNDFGERIETSLVQTVEAFGDKLTKVVMDVNVSSSTLDRTVEKFDASLTNFAVNMKDLSEFNVNLRNNIERMDVDFVKVTEALTETSKVVVDNYRSIEGFSSDIKSAATEMTSYNRQVVSDIGNLVEEVQTTVGIVKKFAEAMDSDMQQHNMDLASYQQNLSTLLTKLGNEIGTLGQHAALSFADALAQNSKELTLKIKESLDETLKDLFDMMTNFKKNERLFAKTIASLPDQTLAYNEAAVSKLDKQLEDIKNAIEKN